MMVKLKRKRLSLFFCVLGVALMGVDLLLTGNFFVHIGELMAASILCFIIGIALDRGAAKKIGPDEQSAPPGRLQK